MKKRVLSVILTVCLIFYLAPAAFAAGTAFTDVKADDWFADVVEYVYENNLMNGMGGNSFAPNGSVSRAMVWTTLARADGVNTDGSDPWYLAGQKWAMEKGVSDGTNPMTDISREQLVTMLYRYMGNPQVNEEQMKGLLTFPDADQVSVWAQNAMAWAIDVGVINGNGGNVAPQDAATRAQLATVLYRYVENVVNTEPEPEPEPDTQPSAPVVPNIPVYPVIPMPPQHTHYYNWVSNENGTHTGTCHAGDDAQTEPCADGDDEDTKCDVCRDDLSVYVASIEGLMYATLPESIEAAASDETVKLLKDIDLPTAVVVTKDVTLNLNGKTLTVTNDTVGDGVFHVTSGTLTINGEGTVNGVGKNDWSMAIWADGGSVVINGGTYTNVGAGDDSHYDLIYAKNGGTVEINGGTFTCQTPNWTLNKHDSTNGTIIVKGGTFTGYNPAESNTENPTANFVAEGYYVEENEGVWTVEAVEGTADTVNELIAAVKMGGSVTLGADIDLPTGIVVTEDVTINLNGKTLSVSEDTAGDGVFHVTDGTLTINGEGTVNGVGDNDWSMAIWADGGSVVINGGTYTNAGAGEDNHYDLIYAKNGGTVEINGGTFTCQTPNWTLNKHDSTNGTIIVKGGTFTGYNPAESNTENPTANFVAEGYKSEQTGNTWTVTADVSAE